MKKLVLGAIFILFQISIAISNEFQENLQFDSIKDSIPDNKFSMKSGVGICDLKNANLSYAFNNPLLINFGIEYKFGKSGIFAIELNSHISFEKLTDNPKISSVYLDKFTKLSDKLYSTYGLSFLGRVYTADSDSKFRLGFSIGRLSISQDRFYSGAFDIGLEMYYKIDTMYSISLIQRLMIQPPLINLGSSKNSYNFSFITLNFHNKLNW